MISNLFKNKVTSKGFTKIMYMIYMNKVDLPLNNHQEMIYYETIYIYIYMCVCVCVCVCVFESLYLIYISVGVKKQIVQFVKLLYGKKL